MNTLQTETKPRDYYQGWYHVYVDYSRDHRPACVDLAKLAKVLPHGSGIDGDWRIQVRTNGDVCVHGEYHAMNENGFYCGWKSFRFTLARATKNEYKALMGSCAGQFQVIKVKGTVYVQSFVGGGDASDYLYDTCYWPLADQMDIHAMESGVTVNSEQQAREYRKAEVTA